MKFSYHFPDWEKKFFDSKIRRIREAETIFKLSENETRIENITEQAENATTNIPIQDYNNSRLNDTEIDASLINTTIIPTKQKDKLIFGYFRFICNYYF